MRKCIRKIAFKCLSIMTHSLKLDLLQGHCRFTFSCTLNSVSPTADVLKNHSTTSQLGYRHWYNPLELRFLSFTCECVCVDLVLCNFITCLDLCFWHWSQDVEQASCCVQKPEVTYKTRQWAPLHGSWDPLKMTSLQFWKNFTLITF